jgi:hypothetical protein
MKNFKVFLIIFFFTQLCFKSIAQTYREGYSLGYKEGYCYGRTSCNAPNAPNAPNPSYGKNTYKDGYNEGFIKGQNEYKNKNANSSSPGLSNVPYQKSTAVDWSKASDEISNSLTQINQERDQAIAKINSNTVNYKSTIQTTTIQCSSSRLNKLINGVQRFSVQQVDVFHDLLMNKKRMFTSDYEPSLQLLFANYQSFLNKIERIDKKLTQNLAKLDPLSVETKRLEIDNKIYEIFDSMTINYTYNTYGKRSDVSLQGHRYLWISSGLEVDETLLFAQLENVIKVEIPNTSNSNNLECDSIFMLDGSSIQGKVIEILTNEITYKRCNTDSSPLYHIEKSKIKKIKYKDGAEDLFNSGQ